MDGRDIDKIGTITIPGEGRSSLAQKEGKGKLPLYLNVLIVLQKNLLYA